MTTIQLTRSQGAPTSPTLHLLPFHIAHDGPAPLSTYFLVSPQPAEPSSSSDHPADSPPADPEASATSEQVQPKPTVRERFLSSFRGRALKGLQLPLPEGYTGVLLRSSTPPAPRRLPSAHNPSPSKRRQTRKRAASPIPVLDSEDDLAELNEDTRMREDEKPRKELRVEGVFDSFVLWNADVPVEEGEDGYARALGEWHRLHALIHDPTLGEKEASGEKAP